jgi:hypothetical protein
MARLSAGLPRDARSFPCTSGRREHSHEGLVCRTDRRLLVPSSIRAAAARKPRETATNETDPLRPRLAGEPSKPGGQDISFVSNGAKRSTPPRQPARREGLEKGEQRHVLPAGRELAGQAHVAVHIPLDTGHSVKPRARAGRLNRTECQSPSAVQRAPRGRAGVPTDSPTRSSRRLAPGIVHGSKYTATGVTSPSWPKL